MIRYFIFPPFEISVYREGGILQPSLLPAWAGVKVGIKGGAWGVTPMLNKTRMKFTSGLQ